MARQVKALLHGSRKNTPGYVHREHTSKKNRRKYKKIVILNKKERGGKKGWKQKVKKYL